MLMTLFQSFKKNPDEGDKFPSLMSGS